MPRSNPRRSRAILVAALLPAFACHRGRLVPVNEYCGQRAAVALYRGAAPRRTTASTGALVVRVVSADSGLVRPEGPVRLYPTTGKATNDARTLALSAGVARSGPLRAGRWVVEANGTGYRPSRLTVAVRPGATDTVRFRLAAMCLRRASR